MTPIAYRLANQLYGHCYPLYRPLYAAWKAYADRRERAFLREVVKPGMRVLDVGANIGVYTRFLAGLLQGDGEVHAFEPDPLNFSRLVGHLRDLPNVTPINSAVGARSGTLTLYQSADMNVDHRTFDSGDGRPGVEVPVVALDDYMAGKGPVHFIKLDVQGFEENVLNGAQQLLVDSPDVTILMEFWPYGLRKAGSEPAKLLALLRQLGFSERSVVETTTVDIDAMASAPGDASTYCNLILTRV